MLFWVSVAVATLVVTAVVVWPLLSARPAAVPDARNEEQRRLAVFRDRKREIERERAAGRLSDSDAAQAQTDLLRQLATDLPAADGMAAGAAAPHRAPRLPQFTALLLVLALPLLTIAVYRHVGTPELAAPGSFAGAARGAPDAAQIEALIAAIEARTRQQPDDGEAWAMLAEARKMQGRHAEAVQAFEQAVSRLAPDARLLTDFAESSALLAGGDFSGHPVALLEQALALNPSEPRAIALMGAAQYRLGNLPRARAYLVQLQQGLQAGSEEATQIAQVVQRIDAELAQGASGAAAGPAATVTAAPSLSGTITLDPQLAARAGAGGILFVIARQQGGPPIPVAVLREAAAHFPFRFALGDHNAMNPERLLSSAGPLILEARLSRSGEVMRQSGDLYGQSVSVKPGQHDVTIVIDHVVSP